MLKGMLRKMESDKGDSTLVSTLIVIPLIVGIFITIIDVSVYFSDRGQILSYVRDGARQVAVFGGGGTSTAVTPLEKAYGQSRTTACAGLNNNYIVSQALSSSTTAVECSVLKNIGTARGIISITVTNIQCGAADSAGNFTGEKTTSIGQQVGCQLTWRYNSIPGSGLSFLEGAKSIGAGPKYNAQVTKVNTTSEVNMSGIPLQNW